MPGKSRVSHRSTGKKVGGAGSAVNPGTAVLKTTGKIASVGKGSGAQTKAPLAKASPISDSLAPTKQAGRTVVPKSTGKSA